MINVRFFGTARITLNMKNIELEDCKTVKQALTKIANISNVSYSKMKQFLVFVNETSIDKLHGYRTKLNDGDEILLLSPSSGG